MAEALTRENGKPVAEAIGSEIAIALDFANYYAAHAPRFLRAPWFNAGQLAMKRKRIRIEREPFGVVGVISPWNYPFMLSAGVVIPALVTGNAVLLKPSEFTPESGELLASLFHEAGCRATCSPCSRATARPAPCSATLPWTRSSSPEAWRPAAASP